MDRPTRVAADLMDAAAVEGERQSRSAKQQLDHWARVGRAVSAQTSAARRRVEAALAGELDERDLNAEERVVFNAELDTSISEAARTIRFGEVLAARGVTTVALDEHGRLTRYHPDGTTSPLEQRHLVRLDLVVGPNGAGKSTFVELVLAPLRPGVTFVNADVIAAARWPDDPSRHAYDAAAVAADTREALIADRVPFIAETVFSHPSKLDLISRAQAAGYTVTLHVLLVPERESVQRVAHRVLAGGHDVPEEKIRSRYARLWPLVADAIIRAEVAHVFDNSEIDGPDEIALFAGGVPLGPCRWPDWAPGSLTDRWPR